VEFIFMLTHHDATIPNALEVYDEVRDLPLRYVGFKDVGQPVARLAELARRIHADGREAMLEVVSENAADELKSIDAAWSIGVDWVLGGTHVGAALALLDGRDLRYCPFPGRVIGHPSILEGTVDEIAQSAKSLTSHDRVSGLDLLAYRYSGDVEGLVAAVVRSTSKPVIAAGTVNSIERITALRRLGVWGFTVGGAVFEGTFPAAPDNRSQVEAIIAAAAGTSGLE
jgi:hypothetical protein